MKMIIGGETEYAVSARDATGHVVPQEALLGRMLHHAAETFGYTSTSRRGRFLRNGGLFYLDAGLHLEWSTPETTSPFEVVRYLKAGDRILETLATSFGQRELGGQPVFASRACVDYVAGTLWAAHESYMHRVNPGLLPRELIPFLASRVIFGAGGWDHSAPALRFTLSPRASFITTAIDCDCQHVRPLFHTKAEPLSGKTHRLHVACGESLCSDTSNVLRFGATALVLAAIELGERPGAAVTLVAPVAAVQRFAADEHFVTTADLTRRSVVLPAGERRITALGIQRHYLSCVERVLGNPRMPVWAEAVWTLWRNTLEALEARSAELDTTLDWAIKRRLFARRLAVRGITWKAVRAWDAALTRLVSVPNGSGLSLEHLTEVAGRNPEVRARMTALAPLLARHQLSWDGLPALMAARNEMFEMDARFGALGPDGLFNALDASGVLRHRIPAADLGNAVDVPPADTRARLRGNVVGRLSDAGTSYGAEWTLVYDGALNLELDLMDPFETEERWRPMASLPAAVRLSYRHLS